MLHSILSWGWTLEAGLLCPLMQTRARVWVPWSRYCRLGLPPKSSIMRKYRARKLPMIFYILFCIFKVIMTILSILFRLWISGWGPNSLAWRCSRRTLVHQFYGQLPSNSCVLLDKFERWQVPSGYKLPVSWLVRSSPMPIHAHYISKVNGIKTL